MNKIAVVGEAWGEHEERVRAPFSGPSGYELTRMLSEAGVHRSECFLTNVFNLRPRPTNDVINLCQEGRVGNLPPLRLGKYLQARYHPELLRVLTELNDLRPNITVLLGNTATWLFLGSQKISKIRGTVTTSTPITGGGLASGLKCLPTYHPAYLIRGAWDQRPATVLDLKKARRESEFPEIRRPHREVYIDPTLQDLETFYDQHLRSAESIAFDIETAGDQITCIGFAPSPAICLVVPFQDLRTPSHSFWPTPEDEIKAWSFVRRVLNLPCRKIAQNGLYDVTFLWKSAGIPVRNFEDDTMLLHHALQPESEKSLRFLGSIYTNEGNWKMIKEKGKTTIKRDE